MVDCVSFCARRSQSESESGEGSNIELTGLGCFGEQPAWEEQVMEASPSEFSIPVHHLTKSELLLWRLPFCSLLETLPAYPRGRETSVQRLGLFCVMTPEVLTHRGQFEATTISEFPFTQGKAPSPGCWSLR